MGLLMRLMIIFLVVYYSRVFYLIIGTRLSPLRYAIHRISSQNATDLHSDRGNY